jgi:hypothetical protein
MPATEEERQAWLEQSEREKNELMDSFQAQAQSQARLPFCFSFASRITFSIIQCFPTV